MDNENKMLISRAFRDNSNLKRSIHKGTNLDEDLNTLSQLTGITLFFLNMYKDKVQSLAFDL